MLLAGERENIETPEDAVTAAGYDFVDHIAQEFGHELQEECSAPPRAWELLQDEDSGVGAGEQVLARQFRVDDGVEGIEIAGVGAVAREDRGGESALQRG